MLLFGIWPIAILGHALAYSTTSNKRSLRIVIGLGLGVLAAALPILIYHVVHRSLGTFFDDTVLRAIHVSGFDYFKLHRYWEQMQMAADNVVAFESFGTVVNGFYWIILPLLALFTGVAALLAVHRSRSWSSVGSLPIISVFYAQVALLQQVPIYLFYTLPLSFAALLWLFRNRSRSTVVALSLGTLFLSVVSIHYHAAQPISRLLGGTIDGERIGLVLATTLPRTGLWIDPQSLRIYTEVVQTIQDQTQPNDTIFVVPYNPEFYFLAERRNPFRFWNTAVGVRNDREATAVMNVLTHEPPRIIV